MSHPHHPHHSHHPHQAQREFLRISSLATKPSDGDLATILKPTADLIGQIQVMVMVVFLMRMMGMVMAMV